MLLGKRWARVILPMSPQRLSLPRLIDSKLPGKCLWTWELHPSAPLILAGDDQILLHDVLPRAAASAAKHCYYHYHYHYHYDYYHYTYQYHYYNIYIGHVTITIVIINIVVIIIIILVYLSLSLAVVQQALFFRPQGLFFNFHGKMYQHMATCGNVYGSRGNVCTFKATYGNMSGIRGTSAKFVPTPSGSQWSTPRRNPSCIMRPIP